MTYLPFVYLILLSPEEYYNNKAQWTNGYQQIPLAYGAKKFDANDKIQQPQVYVPIYYLPTFVGGPGWPAVDPPDKKIEEKKDEAGEDKLMMEEESGEMTTMRNDEGASEEDTGVDWRQLINTGNADNINKCEDGYVEDEDGNCQKLKKNNNRPIYPYSLLINKCGDGFVKDENGNCQKEILRGEKRFNLERKKRDLQHTFNYGKDSSGSNNEEDNTLEPLQISNTRRKRSNAVPGNLFVPPEKHPINKPGLRTSIFCRNGYQKDENNDCVKGVLPKKYKQLNLQRKKRANTQNNSSGGKMIFKLSKKISVRDRRFANERKNFELEQGKLHRGKRFAEEKKLSYADIVKYGRKGPPTPKPTEPKNRNIHNSTSKSPTASTSTTKTPSPPSVAPMSKPDVVKPKPSTPIKAPTTEASKPATVDPFKPKGSGSTSSKPPAGDPSLMLINSEKNPTSVKSSTSKSRPTSDDPLRIKSTPDPFLFLQSTYCKSGYEKDENDNCVKVVEKKSEFKKRLNLDRKKRDSDYNSQLLRRLYTEAERNRQGRNSDYATGTTESLFQRRVKKIENDTRKTDSVYSPVASSKSSQETSDKIPLDEKNAASDGFGYISKECSKLVPGLVSDGAGGCTKAVKVKEKILRLERKKRQAQTAFINFIDPSNRLRKNSFTITITIKGLNSTKQQTFTNQAREQPIDGGDKAVADNGFGVTSSKCDNLVPGLVPDGVGGCTKAITNFRKRNKFSFIVRNVENSQPIIDLDYENPEPELVSINPGDDDDPDADII